jgi:hypothetical protein
MISVSVTGTRPAGEKISKLLRSLQWNDLGKKDVKKELPVLSKAQAEFECGRKGQQPVKAVVSVQIVREVLDGPNRGEKDLIFEVSKQGYIPSPEDEYKTMKRATSKKHAKDILKGAVEDWAHGDEGKASEKIKLIANFSIEKGT